ncbi:FlgD immunoglobulin-like domain containing protein [Patulibacter sp. NPDC049589]|uniref:FlgD immunoglobulin-like domain containing protein n=1 Tax=Patulibacter sp. NPDC049589 TaxID=3154731 RepID=UPI00341F3117
MTRAARVVFGILVVATVASFFLAQRLKNQPAVLQRIGISPAFSPDGDGHRDKLAIYFVVKRAQPITVQVVDPGGQVVRTLATDVHAKAYTRNRFVWDGKDDAGRVATDGRYRLKVVLEDEGRSIVAQTKSFELRTDPPRPSVRGISIAGGAPGEGRAILPTVDGKPLVASLRLRGWEPSARVVRTGPGAPTVVKDLKVEGIERDTSGTQLSDAAGQPRVYRARTGTATWDGTLEDGSPAPAGTYVIQVCVRDRAGVRGCGPRAAVGGGLPGTEDDGRLRGKGGITVRDIGVQANPAPVTAGNRLTFFVDARGKRYDWVLRRVGTRRPVDRGTSDAPVLKVRTRSERGALYRLAVSANGHRVEVPALANDRAAQPVLVVLPALTWQGLDPLDDDGDGLANTLSGPEESRNSRVRAPRVLSALPRGFDTGDAPALAWLARHGKRFELTSDLALALGQGPKIAGHEGVLLVGEERWISPDLGKQLRDFVRGGGTLAGLDPAGLRRSVDLRKSGSGAVLRSPGPFTAENALGLTSRGSVRLQGPVQNDKDDIGLFDGSDGRFDGYPVGWPLEDTGENTVVASAVDRADHVLIAAVKVGDGFVIRTGLPDFARRLATDPDTSELMDSTWRRLSR